MWPFNRWCLLIHGTWHYLRFRPDPVALNSTLYMCFFASLFLCLLLCIVIILRHCWVCHPISTTWLRVSTCISWDIFQVQTCWYQTECNNTTWLLVWNMNQRSCGFYSQRKRTISSFQTINSENFGVREILWSCIIMYKINFQCYLPTEFIHLNFPSIHLNYDMIITS
jgi:hypothetical protein